MKIFDTDVSVKYICFEMDDIKYLVQFRYSLWKGIYDVSIWRGNDENVAKITLVYPPLKQWFPEIWRILFPVWLHSKVRRFRRLRNK